MLSFELIGYFYSILPPFVDFLVVISRITPPPPKDASSLIQEPTYAYVMLYGKEELGWQMKWRLNSWP